jgi:dihydrofolate synthase/folylpolyglutamate synthase
MSGRSASLDQSLQRLYQRTAHGLKLGLAATERLFDALELSRQPFPIVHIAGTNGKGSTAAMLSSILHQAGYRTGRFTSPHLVRFNERFTVDEEAISDEELEAALSRVEAAAAAEDLLHPDRPLTFFEITTALTIQYFADRSVDVAVVETGLGGRLDSTSVLQPSLCVITRIDLDHTAWLGDSLDAVAMEKAGILKSGVPVVLAQQQEEALEVLLREAARLGCPVLPSSDIQITGDLGGQGKLELSSSSESYGRISPPLPGQFQLENLASAVTAAEALSNNGFDRVNRETVRKGLQQVTWPGRCQVLEEDPLTLIDCAHNPGGMAAFLKWAGQRAGKKPLGLIFSASGDKDLRAMAHQVAAACHSVWVCELNTPRTASQEELTAVFDIQGLSVQAGSFQQVRQAARDWQAETGGALCIAGSIYLVGMALSADRDAGELF